jgi:HSP20 family protein
MSERSDPFGELERALEEMTRGFGGTITDPFGGSAPVDVRDEGDRYVLLADLPGVDPGDIDLQVCDGRRVDVAASRDESTDVAADRFVTRERRRESVDRSVALPEAVDESATEASYDAGVLTVSLPKRDGGGRGTDIPVE